MNGVVDTLECTNIGKQIADGICHIALDYKDACEDVLELFCAECKAHTSCSYSHLAACACTNHGYCSKASCPTGH